MSGILISGDSFGDAQNAVIYLCRLLMRVIQTSIIAETLFATLQSLVEKRGCCFC